MIHLKLTNIIAGLLNFKLKTALLSFFTLRYTHINDIAVGLEQRMLLGLS